MHRFSISTRYLLALIVAAFSVGLAACGDDSPTSPGPTGSSTIHIMHTNPGITSDVVFKSDTTTLGRLAYGIAATASVNNGSRTIAVRATDGTQLTSQSFTLDTTLSVWVVFTGNLDTKESFTVSTKKLVPPADNASVRVVHASKNAGDINIKINTVTGFPFTQNKISYKSATEYVTVPVAATNKLIVLKAEGVGNTLEEIPTAFVSGKSYTVIVYGSTDVNADPSVQLTYKIVED